LALIASLFVSLTIVPVIAFWFLKAKERSGQKLSLIEEENLIAKIREEENEKERKSILQKAYLPVLRSTQKRPVITLVAAFLVLIFTFNLIPLLKTNFIGNSGSNSFSITQTIPLGSSIEAKSTAAAKVEKLLMDTGDTEAVTTTIGANDSRVAFGQQAGGTQFQVSTKKSVNGETFQAKMEKLFKENPDLGTVKFQSGGSFGSSGTVDVTVTAKTDEQLRAGVELVTNALKGKIKDVNPEITSTLSQKQRTLKVTIDRVAASRVGLSEIVISQIVASAMSPQSIGTININNTATAIYIKSGTVPTTVDQVKAIQIGPLRLAQLAKVELVSVPTKITTQDGERAATVSLTPDPKASLTTITADVQKALDSLKDKLPVGVSLLPIGGVSADQAESFSQLLMALLAAICIVYLIMVATFSLNSVCCHRCIRCLVGNQHCFGSSSSYRYVAFGWNRGNQCDCIN
ncbi:MAG: efflux RND transporter permease subunit, partial [Micrococcales bacterium]|nr:efflux RND transporter permease subunit [Micrococcales bacterium]